MKRTCLKVITTAALVLVAAVAGKAVASSAAFAFTMKLRYVDGERNKQLHTLDAGGLTLSGNIWVTSKKARATSSPSAVTVTVYKTGIIDSEKCHVSVTPDRIFNNKVSFSKSCGQVEAGTYCVKVSKPKAIDDTGDGWEIQGSGTLSTK